MGFYSDPLLSQGRVLILSSVSSFTCKKLHQVLFPRKCTKVVGGGGRSSDPLPPVRIRRGLARPPLPFSSIPGKSHSKGLVSPPSVSHCLTVPRGPRVPRAAVCQGPSLQGAHALGGVQHESRSFFAIFSPEPMDTNRTAGAHFGVKYVW